MTWDAIAASKADVAGALTMGDRRQRTFFIVPDEAGLRWLVSALVEDPSWRLSRGRLLAWADVVHDWLDESLLEGRFETWLRWPPVTLPSAELVETMMDPARRDLCIGGAVDLRRSIVVLVRGDLDIIVAPLASFRATGAGLQPSFEGFAVADYGQTLRFGEYEASFDAVLYELDGDYRRRLRGRRLHEERGLGPSLRRLRLQQGLHRTAFPDVSSKTIARIERGETKRPRAATLARIARRLGVAPEEIATF